MNTEGTPLGARAKADEHPSAESETPNTNQQLTESKISQMQVRQSQIIAHSVSTIIHTRENMEQTELQFKEHLVTVGAPYKEEIMSKVKALKQIDQKTLAAAVNEYN